MYEFKNGFVERFEEIVRWARAEVSQLARDVKG